MNFKNIEGGDDRQIGNLARQSSIYTLTFDEFQNTLGGPGKDFGSMNMEEFLKNIWTAEEMQAMVSSMGSVVEPSSTGGALQRQGSLTLPRTLSQKTVDEVWRDLYQGSSEKDVNAMAGSNFQQQQQTLGEITLEEFLVKAGVVREDTQIAARPNNSSEFYSELSQSNNGAALPFGYQQLNQSSNRLDGIGAIDNKATICNISQMTNKSQQLPINVDGVAARQQIFLNQTSVSYGPSMHTVEASNPSMRGTTISESMIGNGLGQGVATVAGAPARAGGVDLGNVTTRPPNRLTFDGIGKRNRDSSSLSTVPYIFSGSLRGRRCSGAVEKVVERRQRRMIKNRESAARSRARKQAYTMELEAEIVKLKEENQALQKKQAELLDMRKKQLLEILNQQRVSKKQCIGRTRTGPWEVNEEYGKEVGEVVEIVLEALSEGLGPEKATLKNSLGGDEREMEMKINFYPPCPWPELALGVVAHTDMSALTVLVPNEITGLQIIKDGNWVAVDYCPGALYIDIGDQIEILSNGKYKSVLHRSTVNKEKVRMSWAVFCAPPKDATIGPYSQLVDDKNLPLFKAKTYDEYRYSKIHKIPQ